MARTVELQKKQGEEPKTIIFRTQEDNKTILETGGYKSSLFYHQYEQALTLIQQSWKNKEDKDGQYDDSNVIAFCGDRGEGKTSCLRSVRYLLSNADSLKEMKSLMPNLHFKVDSIFALELLDPSYFDDTHNVIELVMGQMFELVTNKSDSKNFDLNARKSLMQRFQKAKTCMTAMKTRREARRYDEMEELTNFASSVQLRKAIRDLISEFLDYFDKEKLLICVDDIDMNMEYGYQMVEDIRKYLCTSNCIVFVAVKIEQLQKLVQTSILKAINSSSSKVVTDEQVEVMAQKYVAKFIPENHRIKMPSSHFIADQKVKLYLSDGSLFRQESISVKETIVRLIFEKTRYLFYNGRTTSPIVPKNLRSIRQLLGMLCSMPAIPFGEKKEDQVKNENKTLFRLYFYQSWIKNLSADDQSFAKRLAQYEDVISVNKYVATYLGERCTNKKIVSKDDKTLFSDIVALKNRSHNISVGDVFYLIRQIETINTDEDISALLFFICAFYSMGLYARYDELIDEILAKGSKKKTNVHEEMVSIYKHDRLYEGTNTLQKVLNGAYFIYEPGTLITNTSSKDYNLCRDHKIINGAVLGTLLTELNAELAKGTKVVEGTPLYYKLHRCEYFLLTTLYQVDSNKLSVKLDRTAIEAPFIGAYENITRQYIAFDFLAIFYNIVNIEYAFAKFGGEGKKLWAFVQNEPLSLYNLMIKAVGNYRKVDVLSETKEEQHHLLLSDAVIRVSEVQLAIVDALNSNRLMNKHRDNGNNVYKLASAYDDITKLDISLYPNYNGEIFKLVFAFLQPIIQYLGRENEDEFNRIFNIKVSTEQESVNVSPGDFSQRFPTIHKSRNVNTKSRAIYLLRQDAAKLPDEKDRFWTPFFNEKQKFSKEEILKICLANYYQFIPYL